jgi:hypothetical protein
VADAEKPNVRYKPQAVFFSGADAKTSLKYHFLLLKAYAQMA